MILTLLVWTHLRRIYPRAGRHVLAGVCHNVGWVVSVVPVWRRRQIRTNSWSVRWVTLDWNTRVRVNCKYSGWGGSHQPHAVNCQILSRTMPYCLTFICINTTIMHREPRVVRFDPSFSVSGAFTVYSHTELVVTYFPRIKMSYSVLSVNRLVRWWSYYDQY